MVNCKEYIFSDEKRRGKGTSESLGREVIQIFSKEGKLVAEKDPCGGYTMEDMYSFAKSYFAANCALTIEMWKGIPPAYEDPLSVLLKKSFKEALAEHREAQDKLLNSHG